MDINKGNGDRWWIINGKEKYMEKAQQIEKKVKSEKW